MNTIKNLATATKTLLNVASSTISVTAEVLVDSVELLHTGIKATPATIKATLEVPFAAGKGYIMESEGIDAEEAEARAYKYVNQSVAQTIKDSSEGAGKLLADMLKEEA